MSSRPTDTPSMRTAPDASPPLARERRKQFVLPVAGDASDAEHLAAAHLQRHILQRDAVHIFATASTSQQRPAAPALRHQVSSSALRQHACRPSSPPASARSRCSGCKSTRRALPAAPSRDRTSGALLQACAKCRGSRDLPSAARRVSRTAARLPAASARMSARRG